MTSFQVIRLYRRVLRHGNGCASADVHFIISGRSQLVLGQSWKRENTFLNKPNYLVRWPVVELVFVFNKQRSFEGTNQHLQDRAKIEHLVDGTIVVGSKEPFTSRIQKPKKELLWRCIMASPFRNHTTKKTRQSRLKGNIIHWPAKPALQIDFLELCETELIWCVNKNVFFMCNGWRPFSYGKKGDF